MRLGSGTYKEIALDALKGNWVKTAVRDYLPIGLACFHPHSYLLQNTHSLQ